MIQQSFFGQKNRYMEKKWADRFAWENSDVDINLLYAWQMFYRKFSLRSALEQFRIYFQLN